MRWLLKKFFWSMVFSSMGMVAIQISPMRDKANQALIKQVNGLKHIVASRAPDSLKGALGSKSEIRSGISTTTELKGTVGEKSTVSKSSNEYVIDDENYVMIQGRYYKARPDNTYMVNGEKVFYVSNRKSRGERSFSSEERAEAEAAAKSMGGDNIQMPTSPAEMMKTLQQRNEALKELENSW